MEIKSILIKDTTREERLRGCILCAIYQRRKGTAGNP